MATTACVNIKPCKVRQSEEHNRRRQEYMARINKEKIYIREDLTTRNESWQSDEQRGDSLQAHHDYLAALVKEKTKRKLQEEGHWRKQKNGKMKWFEGSSPIREGVALIKEDTTMEQLKAFCDACQATWGITPLQIHIHRDEGHYEDPETKTRWNPNYHAHIIWNWIDYQTGKSIKIPPAEMCKLQTLCAEMLGMEQGKSKEETGAEHLERNDYILAKQQRELAEIAKATEEKTAETERLETQRDQAHKELIATLSERNKARLESERAKADKQALLQEKQQLAKEAQAKQAEIVALDETIAAKTKEADQANGSFLLSKAASVFGKGDVHRTQEENRMLRKRNAEVERQLAEVPNTINQARAKLQKQFDESVPKEIAKRTKSLQEELEKQRKATETWQAKAKAAEERNQADIAKATASLQTEVYELNESLNWRNDVLAFLANWLRKVSEVFTRAIKAIIDYAKDRASGDQRRCRFLFENEEAAAIKKTMVDLAGDHGNHVAVGNFLVQTAAEQGKLSDREMDFAYEEVDRVANHEYDRQLSGEVSIGR